MSSGFCEMEISPCREIHREDLTPSSAWTFRAISFIKQSLLSVLVSQFLFIVLTTPSYVRALFQNISGEIRAHRLRPGKVLSWLCDSKETGFFPEF